MEVNDLQEICTGLNVQVSLAKAGKLLAVRNVLVRYLSLEEVEDSDDAGLQMFQDVSAQIDAKVGSKKSEKQVKKENGGSVSTTENSGGKSPDAAASAGTSVAASGGVSSNTVTGTAGHVATGVVGLAGAAATGLSVGPAAGVVTRVERLREFKLYGTVGDGKNCLGYGTICHRIQEGKDQGYPINEILSVVVRSMEAGSQLQKYFEGHPRMPEAEFMAILKNHYALEGYMKLLMQLGQGRQGPKEKTIDFVYRMTRLRDDIIAVAKDEGGVVDAAMVNKQCFYVISVEIASNTVYLELGNVLKNTDMKDFELFKEVNAAVAREEEYLKLLAESSDVKAKTSSVQSGSGSVDDDTNKQLLAEIKKLNISNQKLAARVNEMAVVREEVAEMKKYLAERDGRPSSGGVVVGRGRNTRFIPKCEPCMKSGDRCNHCAVCGELGHKQKDCSKNT